MARKRTKEQPELRPAPAAPAPPPFELPRLLKYRPEGETEEWLIERFDLLAAEFSMTVKSAAEVEAVCRAFHTFASPLARKWQMARKLFGIAPMIASPETDLDDLRTWSRDELEANGFEVTAELDALRVMWNEHTKREASVVQPETASTRLTEPDELPLDDKIVERFNFSDRIFRINVWDPLAVVTDENGKEVGKGKEVPRSEEENRAERDWFVKRVQDWQKMLEDRMGGTVARTALMNDLYLRRMESEIATASPKGRQSLYEQKNSLTREYNNAIEKLQEMFPDMAVAGRVTFKAVISDLVAAHLDYYGRSDRRLVDKVFTAAEIEFQLRSSLQLDMRHRFSLGLAIVENIHGLYDPEFRPLFKPSVLKKIDTIVRAAREAAVEIQNETVVDLENGVAPGEGDQFEDFNDEECPECHRWHPSGKRCDNPHCRLNNPA